MKPRLYKKDGLWRCFTFDGQRFISGIGWTKSDAYDDWTFWMGRLARTSEAAGLEAT